MIGAVADDFTGATDAAVAFRRAGLRTVVLFGQPSESVRTDGADVVVVGLKTRTIEPSKAVAQSLAAVDWLERHGARRFYFKYCSTFDSRPRGNIGPVADAMAERLGADVVPMVPASPEHGRTQYLGYLFVGDVLLSDSPMRHHPLTPMTDSVIPRVLQQQTAQAVALVRHDQVRRGGSAVVDELDRMRDRGVRYAVIDAVETDDLATIGTAVADRILIGGGAGLAGGVAAALVSNSRGANDAAPEISLSSAPAAALAGSCSARTLEQVGLMRASHVSYFLDAIAVPDPVELARQALGWYDTEQPDGAPLIYSSVPPEQLARVQAALGPGTASRILEDAAGLIARGLVERGVRRLVVAGGETSGAVVSALGVSGGEIGAEAAPGVPWIHSTEPELALLLKSGNFGEPDLLVRAVTEGQAEEVDA